MGFLASGVAFAQIGAQSETQTNESGAEDAVTAHGEAPDGTPLAAAPPALPDERTLTFGDNGDAAGGGAAGAVGLWDLLRMVLVLAAVLGVIYGLVHILKRARPAGLAESDVIRILDTRKLAANRSLHLVDVAGRLYLVGSGEQAVSLLAEIDDPETIEQVRLVSEAASEADSRRTFRETLGEIVGRSPTGAPVPSALSAQRERLRRLGDEAGV